MIDAADIQSKTLSSSPPADPVVQTIGIVAATDKDMPTIAPQIESYGYRVIRLDPAKRSPPVSDMRHPEILVIVAKRLEPWVMAWVRAVSSTPVPPAILVMVRGLEPIDRILVLEVGADDCVNEDCTSRELIARIRAVTRRRCATIPAAEAMPSIEAADVLSFGCWTIDRIRRRLSRENGLSETLSEAEFAVLDLLLQQPRRIISRETLLEATATAELPETRNVRAIDIQVSRLRKRLDVDGEEIIRTVRGRGYMLLPPVSLA